MSKDPAFLFYPGDWLGGTLTFSRSHKGAYMDLLMAQFNQVSLTIDDIKQILGNDFEMWESKLKSKFKEEKNGLFYNVKLREETIKRKMFTESRRNNLSKNSKKTTHHMDSHMRKHMAPHMENENENENENIIVMNNKIFIKPTVEMVREYCQERGNAVDAQSWHDFYSSKGWMIGKNKMKDWKSAVRTWESRERKVDMYTDTQKRNIAQLHEFHKNGD